MTHVCDKDTVNMVNVINTDSALTQHSPSHTPEDNSRNPAGEDTGPSGSDEAPSIDAWRMLSLVLEGFEEKHEIGYWHYVQQSHLTSTTMFLSWHLFVFSVRLAGSLWNGAFLTFGVYSCLVASLITINPVLCYKRQYGALGLGMLCMGIGRAAVYSLQIFGLPLFYSTYLQPLLIPFEVLITPHFECVPLRMYASVHHALWSVLLIRNDYVSASAQQYPFLFLFGYLAALVIRFRVDMKDRRAYVRDVCGLHHN